MRKYSEIDHGEWMQQFLDRKKPANPKMFANAPDKLSEFQRKVFNILGIVCDGLVNLPMPLDRQYRNKGINWNVNGSGGLALTWNTGLSTFDSDQLTLLVFLCHEARIRLTIEPSARTLRLTFWQRKAEGGDMVMHPNLDEAVKEFRRWFKKDHLINYSEPSNTEAARLLTAMDDKLLNGT